MVAPISEQQAAYAREVAARLEGAGFRVEVDESNEKLGYKIRHWKTQKVPYILVTGKQEVADGTVNVNERGVDEKRTISVRVLRRRVAQNGRGETVRTMRFDTRAVLGTLALILASCQGNGFDSGMGGEMAPPVSNPGSMNGGGMPGAGGLSGGMGNQIAGPNVGPNGQEELTNPGATLAPNEAQYPIGQGPSGMKCPLVQELSQQYSCTLAFNMPASSPGPAAKGTAAPTASPTPTPQPTSSDSDDSDDSSDSPTPRQRRRA